MILILPIVETTTKRAINQTKKKTMRVVWAFYGRPPNSKNSRLYLFRMRVRFWVFGGSSTGCFIRRELAHSFGRPRIWNLKRWKKNRKNKSTSRKRNLLQKCRWFTHSLGFCKRKYMCVKKRNYECARIAHVKSRTLGVSASRFWPCHFLLSWWANRLGAEQVSRCQVLYTMLLWVVREKSVTQKNV